MRNSGPILDANVAQTDARDALLRKCREKIGTSCGIVSSGFPGLDRAFACGNIGEMLIENDPFRGQAIEMRRGNPLVAVATEPTCVPAWNGDDDDFHGEDTGGGT